MDGFDEVVAGEGRQAAPLTGVYREVRALDATESPVAGVLVTTADGPAVLVDPEQLEGWPGWELEGEHVLAPVDIARTSGGHLVVLPWCPHRLRPDGSAQLLTGGQTVTFAVSLMRGAAEARGAARGGGAGPRGAWWADDEGRPRFAAAVGEVPHGATAAAAAAELLAPVAAAMEDRVVRRLLARAVELLGDPARLVREREPLETELFDACAAQPLALSGEAQDERGESAGQEISRLLRSARLGRARTARPSVRESAARRIVARASSAVSAGADRVRGVAGRFAEDRRAAYAAGAVVAVCVLSVGLLWPRGEDPASADASRGPGAAAETAGDDGPARGEEDDGGEEGHPSPDGEEAPTDDVGAREGADAEDSDRNDGVEERDAERLEAEVRADPASAAAGLVRRAAACAEQDGPGCAGIAADTAVLDAAPWADLGGARLEIVDDYGGAALVKASSPGDGPSFYLTVSLHDGRWLLRDAYAAG